MQRIGRALGWLWYYAVPIRRGVVRDNLDLALPELDPHHRRRIALGAFRHVATTALELLWSSHRPVEELLRAVRVEGLDHYQRIRAQGRGVVAVTAHLGNWDLLACSQAAAGVPLTVVSKALASPRLNRIWMRSRSRAGLRLLPPRGSIAELIRRLREAEVVGLVVDQRTPRSEGGQRIPFFGREAWTTVAPAVLAARTKAAILPVFAFRGDDGRHVVEILPEIEPGASGSATMARINSLLEDRIRARPEQWLWLHRRWR